MAEADRALDRLLQASGAQCGLKPDLITDTAELRQFAAFVAWAAWASVANRPGHDHSYTNDFPYGPLVGNLPVPDAFLWSVLSLLMLPGGIAAVLLMFGKFDYLQPAIVPGQASPGQRALVKFFVVVVLLFPLQILAGGATAHYRADPGSLYSRSLTFTAIGTSGSSAIHQKIVACILAPGL